MTGDSGSSSGPAWPVLLDGPAADAARRLVDAVAGRPRPAPRAVRPDLGSGGAGLALAYHQLDLCRPGEGWHAVAVGHLDAAVRGAERMRLRAPGLLGGLGGLAFAAGRLGRPLTLRPDNHAGPADRRGLDLSSGLTGSGAVLLDRTLDRQDGRTEDPAAAERLHAALTDLGRRVAAFPGESPGMAHGPAGPLALLSLALSAGVEVPGQRAAVHRALERLLEHRRDDDWGPDWHLTGDRDAGPDGRSVPASWCHGGPGIARALWLAGTALDDAPLRELARDTLLAALRRPPGLRRVDGRPGLCHGLAGLLLITLRFARDAGERGDPVAPAFRQAAGSLADRLIDRLDGPDGPDGLERLDDRDARAPALTPGLLDGAAGVLLVLLAATTRVPPGWDRALLLS
ncbi:lanthionine synthetase-like protein [Streptomyces sp. 1114.5]|uniref:lanthionine synthetase C family protein n=1 Tax=Streptomyces sp. 1114.5 TaxID=1938830 RepID=UPI000F27C059|nr:lanthionine synthetase C family protein [Streptomyces sp. 1114.5]RKT19327.1 lanthionine synthetase-like protein [Streptomyces sp. 1114.5]